MLAERTVGTTVGSWQALDLIDAGKSAIVLRASGVQDGRPAALKIFAPDLVEQQGRDRQLARIEREVSLVGRSHPNLVSIYDGGACSVTGHLYVAMELLPGPNLANTLQAVPDAAIRPFVVQLASAARFLEEQGLCHRDIKPPNIVVDLAKSSLKLLDLGVMRPTKASALTDSSGQPFLGTLQYSPPEYLFRREQASPDGLRAITFYQIGAVLHDLLTRRPLFQDRTVPFARLVTAVQCEVPRLPPLAPTDLVDLCRDCLHKDPAVRLERVNWERLESASQVGATPAEVPTLYGLGAVVDEIKRLVRAVREDSEDSLPPVRIDSYVEGRMRLDFGFQRSGRFNATVYLQVDVVDQRDGLVRILAATLLHEGTAPPWCEGATPRTVYEGFVGDEAPRSKLGETLLRAVGLAQSDFGRQIEGGCWIEPLS